jgi:hypothetical protein
MNGPALRSAAARGARAPSARGRLVRAFGAALGASLVTAGCTTPATQVIFAVNTDVAPSVRAVLRVTVRWAEDASETVREFRWARRGTDRPSMEGGLEAVPFPCEFTVIPTTGRPDTRFVATVELDLDDRITLRRRLSRGLLRGQTQTVQVYLAGRCLDPTTGCQGAPCTRLLRCEERGLSCGEDGECVAQDTPTATEDGGVDVARVPATCGRFGEGCCLFGAPCGEGFVCAEGICRRCPPGSEGCCDGEALRPDGTPCGTPAALCATGGTCRAGLCVPGTTAANGAVCARSTDPCLRDAVCQDGVCLPPVPVADGTVCERATNACQSDRVCMAGVCNPPQPRPDGTVCAPAAGPCQRDGICMAGACAGVTTVADGTVCAPAAGPCETDGVCMAGACEPPARRPNGTVCARATNSCETDGVCVAGACGPRGAVPDGTRCAVAADPCQVDGTCRAGACTGTTARPDGFVCANPSNPCQTPGTCRAGRCPGVGRVADGTVCARAANACQQDAVCSAGACGAVTNRPNGTVCAPAASACRTDGTCLNGACGPSGNRPNGTVCGAASACRLAATCQTGACVAGALQANNVRPSATTHCCGGVEVPRTSPTHCGVCDNRCVSGSCAGAAIPGFGTQYYCACSGSAQCTPQLCRNGQATLNNRCACRDGSGSTECAGSTVCQMVSNAPNFCRP